ncbi:S-adenosyl-L-methionine-dependent methyltransferase [Daldinia sp. FL1419]|nr:S-adenosyl-L-methionine-dependent methyltransferase [Daldinia sp. FL1419]
MSTRPNHSVEFYREIYNHHAAHPSRWETAHDVGCGVGQVSAELASRFAHVVPSDLNETHLSVAQRRLAIDFGQRISFIHSMGECLIEHDPPASVDLIVTAEEMVLMDQRVRVALETFSRLLQPGGTLAFRFYGRPVIADAKLRLEAQPVTNEIMVRNWTRVIRGSGELRAAGFRRAAEGMASWLDCIELDLKVWADARRIKWNPIVLLAFLKKKLVGFQSLRLVTSSLASMLKSARIWNGGVLTGILRD